MVYGVLFQFSGVIGLNIGGYKFTTRLSTLTRYTYSMLGAMFSGRHKLDKDNKDNNFIDRNGKYFKFVLEFLRDEHFVPPIDARKNVLIEAEYFGIKPLAEKLKRSPPLFPDEVIVDNLRNKIKDYHKIKEKIAQLSTEDVVDQSGISCQPKSQVYVIWYKKIIFMETI
ncbi:KCTD7_14 [Mytilus coruscus]|uniref:KCTD7_14 n=1 Tax=Mytilus coruscus TaxID=42192 RepID=A0A6J8CBR0_MYTCO|nr:KCTD7_14 [Mytilus coruscus]